MDFTGTYRALVVNNVDPEGLARIQVQLPQLMGSSVSGWALPIPAGSTDVPSIGSQVIVAFEGGDLGHPLYFAGGGLDEDAVAEMIEAAKIDTTDEVTTLHSQIKDVQSGVQDALAAAVSGSRVTVFYGEEAPTAEAPGDLWVDTNDGAVVKRWNGIGWVAVDDPLLQKVLVAAQDAQSTVDGRLSIYSQTTPPTDLVSGDVGDLWVDSDNGNLLHRWSGTQWVIVQDRAAAALAAANTAVDVAYEAQTAVEKAAAVVRIDSSRGLLFKQSEGVYTVLTVSVFKGDQIITDLAALRAAYGPGAYLEWQWQRLGETTFGTILATDPRIGNGGFTFTLTPADVDVKVVFRCIVNR